MNGLIKERREAFMEAVLNDEYNTAEDCVRARNRRTAANPSEINANAPKSSENN